MSEHSAPEIGSIIAGPKTMGSEGRCAVIRDPAGAMMALLETAPTNPATPSREEV